MFSDREVQRVLCAHLGHKTNGVKWIFFYLIPMDTVQFNLGFLVLQKCRCRYFIAFKSHKALKDLNEKTILFQPKVFRPKK
jgi:hypothetical protein